MSQQTPSKDLEPQQISETRTPRGRRLKALAAIAALSLGSLALAGCGNDDEMPPMEEPADPPMEEPAEEAPMGDEPAMDEDPGMGQDPAMDEDPGMGQDPAMDEDDMGDPMESQEPMDEDEGGF